MLRGEQCVKSLSLSDSGGHLSLTTCTRTHRNHHPHSLLISNQRQPFSYPLRLRLRSWAVYSICCMKHPHGPPISHLVHPDDDFVQASLLLSETVKHHQLRKLGFQQDLQLKHKHKHKHKHWKPQSDSDPNSLGLGLLGRFKNPTIFLKISCQGDFLLPIVVGMASLSSCSCLCLYSYFCQLTAGEYALETLIHSLNDDHHEEAHAHDYSTHFQFLTHLVLQLGHEVKMVKITKRVVNTYFARIYVGKVGERESFSVDARPSDAMNLAKRCKAPIYVNKEIVLTDAIAIAYGTGRIRDTKPIYDVLLDSPMEGPDTLVEELNLLQNMKLAVKEERYSDAAMFKDKLIKLRHSGL